MKLTKTAASRDTGTHELANIDLKDAKLVVNRPSQKINVSFFGQDGSSKYSYCFAMSLQEFNFLQSAIFKQLSSSGSVNE
jgi:hypothetical protein